MKLIVEDIDRSSLEFITESVEGTTKKMWKIKGPFLQAETKNRNGRTYPQSIIEREVTRYVEERVKTSRALGELDHPPTPALALDRVSHLIEDLHIDGNSAIGTAKVLDTPMGKIAQALLEGGVKLGVSSRGLGTMKGELVGEDYNLICIDIVGDPSALNAYVDGILESKEYVVEGSGVIVERAMENFSAAVAKNGTRQMLEDLKRFLNDIRKGF